MPHKNPTLAAQTQVLDPAHPSPRVGSGGSPDLINQIAQNEALQTIFSERLEVISKRYEDTDQIPAELTPIERMQLSEVTRLSLEDEITLMRKSIKAFAKASEGVQEGDPYPKDLGKVLDMLGLSCSRIAGLMRVQLLLQGPQSDGLMDDLIDLMGSFVDKMAAEEGDQND